MPAAQIEAIEAIKASNPAMLKRIKSPEQGAATTVWAAISGDLEGRGGKYLWNCAVAQRGAYYGDITKAEYVSHTYNAKAETRLWNDSMELVGLEPDRS